MDTPSTSNASSSTSSINLDLQTRQLAMGVLDKCTLESENKNRFDKLHQTIPRVALYTELPRSDVKSIIMHEEDDDIEDEQTMDNPVFDCVSEEIKQRVISNTINEYKLHENKDHTLATLKDALLEKIMFPFINSKLSLIINKMGYQVMNTIGSTYIIESPDRTMERYVFLKKMNTFRKNQRHIYYIHKIYADKNLYMSKLWNKTKQHLNEEKYVIFSAGSWFRLMKESLSIIKMEQAEGEKENGHQFKQWLTLNLFPFLPKNSVIVIDQDVYLDLQNIPPEVYRMETLCDWMEYKGIPLPSKDKQDITECAMKNQLEKCRATYDDIFTTSEHELLIVPQYSTDFNLLELAWDLIIDKILPQHRGTVFTFPDFTKLITETSTQSQKKWAKLKEHVLTMEREFWTKDKRMQHLIRDDK